MSAHAPITLSPPQGAQLVHRPEQLGALLADLGPLAMIALDTEFHAEQRYLPDLLLVQLAAPDGRAWIIDPLTIPISALGPVLRDKTWVTHGGAQDIRLLHAHAGALPSTLLDTQLLAGVSGLPWPSRLGDLAATVLGTPVDKAATLEDWRKRPLPPHQLAYAITDARVTLQLAAALSAPAGDRVAWAIAAGAELIADTLHPPTDGLWQQLDVAARLDGPTRAALSALLAWRQSEAERQNISPGQIFSTHIALDLARRAPTDLGALAQNRRVPAPLVRRHGPAIIDHIQRALRSPVPAGPTTQSLAVARALGVWAEIAGPALGIAAGLALPDGLRTAVSMHGADALTGWRREALGAPLAGFLTGQTQIALRSGVLCLVDAG